MQGIYCDPFHFSPSLFLPSALPETDPKITGGRPRYQIGDVVRVNCTSGRSKPAASLTWFINGEVADPSYLRRYETVITGREGLETTILGLEFRVKYRHFKRGDMKLKVSKRPKSGNSWFHSFAVLRSSISK